jgi:hypothetical protein
MSVSSLQGKGRGEEAEGNAGAGPGSTSSGNGRGAGGGAGRGAAAAGALSRRGGLSDGDDRSSNSAEGGHGTRGRGSRLHAGRGSGAVADACGEAGGAGESVNGVASRGGRGSHGGLLGRAGSGGGRGGGRHAVAAAAGVTTVARGALDLEGERVLEGHTLSGLIGNLDAVSLVLAERAGNIPGESLGLDLNTAGNGVEDHESGRVSATHQRDGSRAAEVAGSPLDGVGLSGGDNLALARCAYNSVSRSGILSQSLGGEGQDGSEDGGGTHFGKMRSQQALV